MKKILGCLSVLFVAAQLFAAAPTAPTLYNNSNVDGIYKADIYATGNAYGVASTGRDSLVGADTIRLLNQYPIDRRYQYVLQVWDSGGVADTAKYEIQYFSGDKSCKAASTLIDSSAGSAPAAGISRLKAIDLAVNQTSWPQYITVIVKKPVATLIYKVRKIELLRRRVDVPGLVGNN